MYFVQLAQLDCTHATHTSVISIMDKGLKSLRRIDHYKAIYATEKAAADCASGMKDLGL